MADNEAAHAPPPAAGSSHLLHMGAGCWSGLCSDALTHPLSTLRARLMVERQRSKLSLGQYASQVVRQEGARSLYRGIGMALLGSLPGSALFYLGYEVGKEKLSRVPGMQKDVSHLLAGTAATLSGSLIYSPMEVVVQKTQTQAFGPEASRSIDVFRRVMATEGARGFFRGWVAAQLTWIPYFALYFGFYERVKQAAMDVTGAKTENEVLPGTFLLCGTVAGTVAGAITCPLDVVKTRIQVGLHYPAASGGGSGSGSGSGEAGAAGGRSIVGTVNELWRAEGMRGFTRGIGARVLWLAPGSAIGIAAYEWFKYTVTDYNRGAGSDAEKERVGSERGRAGGTESS